MHLDRVFKAVRTHGCGARYEHAQLKSLQFEKKRKRHLADGAVTGFSKQSVLLCCGSLSDDLSCRRLASFGSESMM